MKNNEAKREMFRRQTDELKIVFRIEIRIFHSSTVLSYS